MHTGGLHVALGDGSVRIISDAVDYYVFQALATIAGGEAFHLEVVDGASWSEEPSGTLGAASKT